MNIVLSYSIYFADNLFKFKGGRAGWHPGDKEHRIVGRQIAWILLRAIHEVLSEWKEADNHELPDSAWHVTAMYENTRAKLAQLDPSSTACANYNGSEDQDRTYYCSIPWKVRGSTKLLLPIFRLNAPVQR